MFNDIAAAERAPVPDASFGLTFAELYTVEGAVRVDALFIDALRAADPALAARLAAARSAAEPLAAKDESTLLIDVAPHVEDFLARLFGIVADVHALEAQHHALAPLFAVKRQFVQRKAMNAYKADVAATFDGSALRAAIDDAIGPTDGVQGFAVVLILPLTFGSNAFVPTLSLPGWLQAWVRLNPVTQVADAARSLLLGLPVTASLGYAVAWIAGIVAVFAPAAVWCYRRRA